MATLEQHVIQWKHNRNFAQQIDPRFRDWQVTAIFYSALHAVDAALCKLNIRVSNHEERNSAVLHNASLAGLRDKYKNLYRICRVTRYDAEPDLWLPKEFLTIDDLVRNLLTPIENEVQRIIGAQHLSLIKMKV